MSHDDFSSYADLKARHFAGWNTWHFRSMLAHVLLPDCAGLLLHLKEYAGGQVLNEALVGRRGDDAEDVRVGPRDYRERYTHLTVRWQGLEVEVESSAEGDDLLLLVTPTVHQPKPATLSLEGAILWNRDGWVQRCGDQLVLRTLGREVEVFASGTPVVDPYTGVNGPHLCRKLDQPVVVSTGAPVPYAEARSRLDAARADVVRKWDRWGDVGELAAASHACVAWNTVYDPLKDRVISPCGRFWCHTHGGYALFCWDTFFAAAMAMSEDPGLAAANAIEMLREATPGGFVPNYAYATGQCSLDRSQPPVGSGVVLDLWRATGWRWLLDETFEPLLRWNRWWEAARDWEGYLAWGSNRFEPTFGNKWEMLGVAQTYGGALESGLDNSPMYDEVPFDEGRGMMALADVGLMSLVIADCRALAELAQAMGREPERAELLGRAQRYGRALQTLWHEPTGIFLNRRLDTGEFSFRLSPTLFYPLLAGVATPEQARRMVEEHLLNPAEFWGEFVMPAIARSDPAFADQDYWRGRIWAPLNYLVYLGLRNTTYEEVRREFVRRSTLLLLQEWRDERHLHENYHAITGDGDDRVNSDPFHHFGGLLAAMAWMERAATG